MQFDLGSLLTRVLFAFAAAFLLNGCATIGTISGEETSYDSLLSGDDGTTTGLSTGASDSSGSPIPAYYAADGSSSAASDGAADGAATGSLGGTTSSDSGSSGSGRGIDVQSGLLTAGTFDDNLNLEVFRSFIGDMQQQASTGIPALNLGQRAVVTVKNDAGNPVGGAVITVAAADPNASAAALLTVPSGTDGRAVFLSGVDAASAGDVTQFTVTVQPPDGAEPVTVNTDLTNLDWSVTVPGDGASLPPQLDLAFVVDCTGSMSDELEYVKEEIKDIANTVAERFPAVTLRYGLVCYRDEGDQYVTRLFDFTTSLQEFQTNLALQSAGGGGDYPEAVQKALGVAGTLSWTAGPVARVLFWIADAPPHAEFAQSTFEKVLALRGAGVRIYPVGSSGVASEAEFIMRTAALLTGAEYIFLTDDSGVGNTHAEPHIPCYAVQGLRQVFIRLITSELAGQRQYPAQEEILRTVGNPVNGVCTESPAAPQQ